MRPDPALSVGLALLVGVAGCYRHHVRAPRDAGPDASGDAPAIHAVDAGPPPACVHRHFGETRLTDFRDHGARSPDLVLTAAGLSTIFLESDGDLGHPFVSLVLADQALAPLAGPLLVGEESHSWAEALALEDGSIAIGWLSDPGLVSRTAMRRIDARGTPFGERIDVDFEGTTCLDLAPAGDLVAVAYRGMEDGTSVAYLAFFDPIGGGRRSERFLLGPDEISPQLVVAAEGVLAILPREGAVTLRAYTPAGPVSAERVLPVERPLGRTVAARGSDGRIVIAMQVGETGLRGLHVVLAVTGAFAAPIEIVPEGFGVVGSRIIAVPGGFVLSWAETLGDFGDGRFLVAHLGPDGAPTEPRRVVFAGQLGSFAGPGLASSGPRTWLATSRPPGGSGHAQLFLAGYECVEGDACDAMDARAPGGCSETALFGYRWDGEACVPLEGCTACEGSDCDALASTPIECEIDHRRCR